MGHQLAPGCGVEILMTGKLIAWILGLALAAMPFISEAEAGSSMRMIDTKTGSEVCLSEMAEDLGSYDAVMFGEFHDQPALHELEVQLMSALLAHRQLALSLEMFERDVQPQVDAYLADSISEKQFLSESRPWENYVNAYRPLVELAKERSCRVLAANVPRHYAAQYARSGNLEGLDKAMMAEHTYAPEGAYKERFFEVMAENVSKGGMTVPESRYQAMYQAQCLKDDTMAESISRYMSRHPEQLIYHVQGEFHGSGHLGAAQKLEALHPGIRLAVIAPVKREAGQSDEALLAKFRHFGEYLVIFAAE